jgi:hypothetical protein
MFENFDMILSWLHWHWGYRALTAYDGTQAWTRHYLYIGPLALYWENDWAYREDADFGIGEEE